MLLFECGEHISSPTPARSVTLTLTLPLTLTVTDAAISKQKWDTQGARAHPRNYGILSCRCA